PSECKNFQGVIMQGCPGSSVPNFPLYSPRVFSPRLFQAPGKEALSSIGLLIQFSIDKIFNGAATI
ncbi:MAG: hypothetical protein WAU62_03695, partial [Dehalococcoidales bacterium]